MQYSYTIQGGLAGVKTNTKKYLAGIVAGVALLCALTVPTLAAGTPNQQACFGQDRAGWIAENSGSAQGVEISGRAGDNAQINHDYMDACQGL